MKKLGIIALVVLAMAAVASADDMGKSKGKGGHQCVPEPITMLALAPGALMLLKRKKQA